MVHNRTKRIIEAVKDGVILDIGAGQEENTLALRKIFKTVISVDILEKNKDTGEKIDVVCDVEKGLPFEDSSADTIVAGEFIEHTLRPFDFLLDCKRVLKDGGRLIITSPNATGFEKVFRNRYKKAKYEAHCYVWSLYELDNLLRIAGFNVLKMETFFTKFTILNFIPEKYRSSMIAVCEKKECPKVGMQGAIAHTARVSVQQAGV